MYIPVSLPNPYTVSIIHDELIYGDIFINPIDLGKNIKATYISNIGEVSLEYCIKTILEENENATFHTIQYSRKQKKICFYTDSEISTEKWQTKEVKQPQACYTQKDVVNSVLSVFDNEMIYDQDCASVYEVLMIYRKLHQKTKDEQQRIKNLIQDKLKRNIDNNIFCCVHDYEYDRHILPIHLSQTWSSSWDKYNFSKERDGTIKEKKIEGFHNYNLLGYITEEIRELIDFYLSIKETKEQSKKRIKAVNSNLFIDIDHYSIDVYSTKYPYYYSNSLYRSKFYTYTDQPEHEYPYSDILNKLVGNEMEFLQKIYIKIDDCPLWIREQLYNKRKEEIIERKRQQEEELLMQKQQEEITESETLTKEEPIQKKLTLFQKIFSNKKGE